jgi:transcriptional regulator GlxA family with amidase domain
LKLSTHLAFTLTFALGAAPQAPSPAAPPAPAFRTRNVAIVLYPGVELLDFAGPTEVFSAASGAGGVDGQPAFRVYTVAASTAPLVSQGVVRLTPEFSIDDAPPPDLIVLPGGNSGPLLEDPRFMAWVATASGGAEVTMSVCTGAFVLARAGLLDGKTATTWYGATDRLRKVAPRTAVQDGRRFVDQGRVVTTAGVSAGIDGALHVVARLLGRAVADHTARYMEYHWTPEPYLAKGYSYLNPGLDDRGRTLQRLVLLEDEQRFAEAAAGYRQLVEKDAANGPAWHRLAVALYGQGDLQASLVAARKAAGFPAQRADALVNVACLEARLGHREQALAALETAVAAGFRARWRLADDEDLDSVRADPRFAALLAKLG